MSTYRDRALQDLTRVLEIETIETVRGIAHTFRPTITRERCVLGLYEKGEWRAEGKLPKPWSLWIYSNQYEGPFFQVDLCLRKDPEVYHPEYFPLLQVPGGPRPMDLRWAINAACYLLDGWAARARDHA